MPHSRHMHHYTLPMSWLYSENKLQLWFWNEMWDKLFKCAIFSKPRNQSNFICNRIGEAFLPCFWWLKGGTGTADNRIFCIESRLMLNKIIKFPFKCSDLCIRRFTNVSSGEILPSKE